MNSPLPNKKVRGSSSGIAIMAVFDLLGRKWNMKIMWELRSTALSFRAIQRQCNDMSPSVLNSRLKQLSEAKLLSSTDDGYQLTPSGISLMETLDPLRVWAKDWQQELTDETQ